MYFGQQDDAMQQNQGISNKQSDENYHYLQNHPMTDEKIQIYAIETQIEDDGLQLMSLIDDVLFAQVLSETPLFQSPNPQPSITQSIDQFQSKQQNSINIPDEINNELFQNIINKYMKGIQPNDQELQQLNEIQIKILESLEDKKVKKSAKNNQNQKLVNKRVEEKQKFFFKKAIKFIEKKFKVNHAQKQIKKKSKKNNKSSNGQEFYDYYFSEVAKSRDLKIENFFHPQKKYKYEKMKEPKTKKFSLNSLNQTYISLILESKQFKQDVKDYLYKNFLEECDIDRIQKIRKFLMKCTQVQNQCLKLIESFLVKDAEINTQDFVKKKILEYILENSKCKVPWSLSDVMEAYNYANSLLNETNDNFTQLQNA